MPEQKYFRTLGVMPGSARHIGKLKHLFTWCFLLFAFTPCVVKGAMLELMDFEYSQPLNKTRSTIPINACQYISQEGRQASKEIQSQNKGLSEIPPFSNSTGYTRRPANVVGQYAKSFSGSSPPMYILFKRLKLDTACILTTASIIFSR